MLPALNTLRSHGPRKLAEMLVHGPDGGEVRLLGQMIIVMTLSLSLRLALDYANYWTAPPPKAPTEASSASAPASKGKSAADTPAAKWVPEVPKPARPASPTPPAVLDLDAPSVLDLDDAPATGARK
jgi:hypothetical protein